MCSEEAMYSNGMAYMSVCSKGTMESTVMENVVIYREATDSMDLGI